MTISHTNYNGIDVMHKSEKLILSTIILATTVYLLIKPSMIHAVIYNLIWTSNYNYKTYESIVNNANVIWKIV